VMMSLSIRRTRDEAVCILAWQLPKVAVMADTRCLSDALPFKVKYGSSCPSVESNENEMSCFWIDSAKLKTHPCAPQAQRARVHPTCHGANDLFYLSTPASSFEFAYVITLLIIFYYSLFAPIAMSFFMLSR
ncbi:hypothetical protein Tco_1199959, partial [Tanacetum coccineum]